MKLFRETSIKSFTEGRVPQYVPNALNWTQSRCFLLVIERLERARCTTARETGVSEVYGRAEIGKRNRSCASRSLQSLNYCGRKKKVSACSLQTPIHQVVANSMNPPWADFHLAILAATYGLSTLGLTGVASDMWFMDSVLLLCTICCMPVARSIKPSFLTPATKEGCTWDSWVFFFPMPTVATTLQRHPSPFSVLVRSDDISLAWLFPTAFFVTWLPEAVIPRSLYGRGGTGSEISFGNQCYSRM